MMTDRERISELLSAYLDGEVTPEEAGAVEQALREDPGVAMELRELTRTRQLLVRLPQAQAPHDFVRTVMARAERKHLLGARQAGGAFRTTRWITLAVAAVVLVAAGVGFV
ncbi:MAG: zf-HC2 domain-containing protein, partial [Phycisphaerae bacterium]|nr:zf-HC2 domain-containing protein [Phycisphaerae bacterium]